MSSSTSPETLVANAAEMLELPQDNNAELIRVHVLEQAVSLIMRTSVTLSRTSNWIDRGECVKQNADMFHPVSGKREAALSAIQSCMGCEVRGECLLVALSFGNMPGVWGATTQRERNKMLKVIDARVDFLTNQNSN